MIIKSDKDTISPYLTDQSGLNGSYCERVFVPENYSEVSDVLKYAFQNSLPVTVSGSGTGVTGGRLPFGGIVISLEKLNKIISFDNEYLVVQAGVPLSEIHSFLKKQNRIYPPDSTEWSASIGGNIATNASGSRTFKYGPTRKYVKELKIALPNGDILDIPRGEFVAKGSWFETPFLPPFEIANYKMPDIKNAAGYYSQKNMDLIDLFIGSEGTLSVILEAKLKTLYFNGQLLSFFVFFDDYSQVLDFVAKARKQNLLSIEFFDENSLILVRKNFSQIPKNKKAAVFFEEEILDKTPDAVEKAIGKWSEILSEFNIDDKYIWAAVEEDKEEEFKKIRHEVPVQVNEIVKLRKIPKVGTDIAVPEENFNEMFSYYLQLFASEKIDYLIFGHIGDCHLHANILPKNIEEMKTAKEIYLKLVKKAILLNGTVSAEHGIGKLKHQFLKEMYGEDGLKEMVRIKKIFDEKGILNRDNIFPKEYLDK